MPPPSSKKPPDKYRCLKLPATSIFRNTEATKEVSTILDNAIQRTNAITTKTYFLLRLWVLEKYHSNQPIPEITTDTISMCAKSILKPSAGPKPKGNNLLLLQEFQKLNMFELEDGKNLSAVLDYYYTTMITSIENNIKLHFFDYVKRFVNSYFKHINQEKLEDKEFIKQLYKELNTVKNDIINNTLTSDSKYHSWLAEHRNKIIPKDFNTNYYYDIKVSPYKYMKPMIFMCLELEKLEKKSFQFFPLQTNAIPRHIQIDTKALIELFVKEGKAELVKSIEANKEVLWDKIFSIKPIMKYYSFDHTIITDGYSVSLRFIHNDSIDEQKQKKKRMKEGKEAVKGFSDEKKALNKETKLKTKIKEPKIIKNKIEITNVVEEDFPYIEDVAKEKLKGKHIFIDPGKRTLLTMMDDNGKFFSYTNRQRIKETKRYKYQNVLKKYKDSIGITAIEESLNKFNSKTCNIEKFKEYINAKLKANKQLIPLYKDLKFRKYKWYAHINKKRTEDRMLNKIEKQYSKEHIIIIGDWSIGKQMKNFISTPNLSIKRKLKERFNVYNIDEFRTSCLYNKTEELCSNLYLPDKTKKERKIHSILTFKMENNRMGCINRDKNGCKNIKKVFNSYMDKNERPEKYRRGYTSVEIKVSNRCSNTAVK